MDVCTLFSYVFSVEMALDPPLQSLLNLQLLFHYSIRLDSFVVTPMRLPTPLMPVFRFLDKNTSVES